MGILSATRNWGCWVRATLFPGPFLAHRFKASIFPACLSQCILAARTSACDLWLLVAACDFVLLMQGLGVEGVAVEWEADATLRSRMRETGSLFLDTVDGKKLECNIKCIAAHSDVVLPVLQRLVNEDGSIGMCSIPALEVEYLDDQRFLPKNKI